MNIKKQVHFLGQVYYKLSKAEYGEQLNKESYERAIKNPMREIVKLFTQLIAKRKMTEEMQEYAALRFEDIDIYEEKVTGSADLPLELQETFRAAVVSAREIPSAKKLIKMTGLTQQEIAKELNVNNNTVSRWSLENSKLSEENRYKLEKLVLENMK